MPATVHRLLPALSWDCAFPRSEVDAAAQLLRARFPEIHSQTAAFKGTQLWYHFQERAEKAREPLTDDDGWGSCMPVFALLLNMRDAASN